MGMRFRKHYPIRTRERLIRPNIVFTKQRLAVFVDGCFWHQCPSHGNLPRANTNYWLPKLARNVDRDKRVNRALLDAGWAVLRAWEHEAPEEIAGRVQPALRALKAPPAGHVRPG